MVCECNIAIGMSVCKFALKLTLNVISPDLILKQKSITIKTLYSDIYRHTHTECPKINLGKTIAIYSRMALAGQLKHK